MIVQYSFNYQFDLREVLSELEKTNKIVNSYLNSHLVKVRLGGKEALEDFTKTRAGDVQIDLSADTPQGARIQYGFPPNNDMIDIDIDGGDRAYADYIKSSLHHYGVDIRAAFGRKSLGAPTHFLVRVEGDVNDFRRFKVPDLDRGGKPLRVELRTAPDPKDKNAITKHVVMPGGIYAGDYSAPDGSVDLVKWTSVPDSPLRKANALDIVRGIATGSLLKVLEEYWTEGSRQTFALAFTGWLARIVYEFETNPKSQKHTLSLVSAEDDTVRLIEFIENTLPAETREPRMRSRAFKDALRKLRNGVERIPGRTAVASATSQRVASEIARYLTLGLDANAVEEVKRILFPIRSGKDVSYLYFPLWEKEYAPVVEEKKARSLTREFTTLVVKPNGQITEKPAIDAAIERGLLTTIDGLEFMPNEPPGAMVYRRGRVVLRENDSIHGKDVRLVFNTFHGLLYPPEPHPDREIGERLIEANPPLGTNTVRGNHGHKPVDELVRPPPGVRDIALQRSERRGVESGSSRSFSELS